MTTGWSVVTSTRWLRSSSYDVKSTPCEPKIQSTARGRPARQAPVWLPPRAATIGAAAVSRQKYGARSFMSPVRKTGRPVSTSRRASWASIWVARTRNRCWWWKRAVSAGLWTFANQASMPVARLRSRT